MTTNVLPTKVTDFLDAYAQCKLDDFRGLTVDEIAEQILTVNSEETDAHKMAEAVVEYLKSTDF